MKTTQEIGTSPSTQSIDSNQRHAHSVPPWLTVFKREVLVKLTDKTFAIGTLISLAILAGALGYSAWSANSADSYDVAATPEATQLVRAIGTTLDQAPRLEGTEADTINVIEVADSKAAEAALRDDLAAAWLQQTKDGWQLTALDEVDPTLLAATEATVRSHVLSANAAAAGTDVAALTRGSEVSINLLDTDANKRDFAKAVGFGMSTLFYLSVLGFGMTLAQSVVEEKQSRVVEVIVTRIPIRDLLIGKVLGNMVLAILQTALMVAVALIGIAFTPFASMLPSFSTALGWYVAFFIVGFLMLACLWAVAGALASRIEDLQASAAPLTFLTMMIFFGGMFLKGTARDVGSFLPPFSAVLMPMRLAAEEATWWEAVIALGLLLATAALVMVLADRLYRRALLQTGGRLSIKQAWSAPT